MAYAPRYFRHHNFLTDAENNVGFNNSELDAEFNALVTTLNQQEDFIRGITNPDGTLKFTTALREMDLVEENRFVATAAQTAFTVASYNTATDRVRVFINGDLLDPNSVTLTNATTVTIPAQTVGTLVVIEVFSAGSGVLTTLALTTNGNGASKIGVEDAGGLLTGTNVETCLAEIVTNLNTFVALVGTVGNYIKKDGSVAFAHDQPMGGFSLTGMRASVANGEAVRHEQLQAVIASLNAATSSFLAKSGGTMTGLINMGNQRITTLATATAGTDAVNLNQVNSLLSSFGGLPTGSITGYGGSSAPSGWALCDGTAYDRTSATYAALFAVIGTTYGVGGGGNDFQVPDMRGRMLIGSGTGSYSGAVTARARGDKGGRESVVLTVANLPAHHHSIVTDNDDTASNGGPRRNKSGSGVSSCNTDDTGGDTAHENMSPFNTGNWLIKL